MQMSVSPEDYKDPLTVKEGLVLTKEKEIPLEIKLAGSQDGKPAMVNFRLYVKKEDDSLQQIHIELYQDSDLGFLYLADYNGENYDALKKANKLRKTFGEFPLMLEDIVKRVVENRSAFKATLEQDQQDTDKYHLTFQQQLEFKTVKIVALDFVTATTEYKRERIQFRYDQLSHLYSAKLTELQDLEEEVRRNDPRLLSQIQKSISLGSTRGRK